MIEPLLRQEAMFMVNKKEIMDFSNAQPGGIIKVTELPTYHQLQEMRVWYEPIEDEL